MKTLHYAIFILFVVNVYCKVLPDYFPQCKRADPQIEQCIVKAVDTLKSQLKHGIPEVNIPPLEPFAVPTLKINKTVSGLRLIAEFRNMKAYGGHNFTIEKFKLNLKGTYEAEMKLTFPSLSFRTDYNVHGSSVSLLVVDMKINGKGKMQANLSEITMIAKGISRVIVVDDIEYLQAKNVVTELEIDDGYVAFYDTERPYAGLTATKIFNASPSIFLKIFNPLINDIGAAIFKEFFNKIFANIPLSEIFT